MRMFQSVVVIADASTLELAVAVRGALEAFRLRVHLYRCVQTQNLLDALSGAIPPADYVVLCVGGFHPPEPEGLHLVRMVEQVDGVWQEADMWLTSDLVGETVNLPGRAIVVCGGCNSGSTGLSERSWTQAARPTSLRPRASTPTQWSCSPLGCSTI